MNNQPAPRTAILLATYNGEKFLAEQLRSFAGQTHSNWRLWASDDGSADATVDILRSFQRDWGRDRLEIITGPRQGFCRNFLSLTAHPAVEADYFAWSDQDDIWKPEKLSRALTILQAFGEPGRPALYCGRTALVDAEGRNWRLSPRLNRRPLAFANALVQSVAGGNTMVFNKAARDLIRLGLACSLPSHDWWAYMMLSGCGGRVFYDETPMVLYRQHGGNLVGENISLKAKLTRIKGLFSGRFRAWNELNTAALLEVGDRLTEESLEALNLFITMRRTANLIVRWRLFLRGGFYRQTFLGHAALHGAVFSRSI